MILTADLHLGMSNNSVVDSESNLPSQLIDTKYRLLEMVWWASKDDHQLVVAGDVFDSVSPKAHVIEALFEVFAYAKKRKVQIILIPGNHDCDVKWDATVVAKAANFDNVTVISAPTVLKDTSQDVAYLPHMPRQEMERWLDANGSYGQYFKRLNAALLIGHGTVAGAKNSSEVEMEAGNSIEFIPKEHPRFHHVILGHIHKQQEVATSRGYSVWYPGSPVLTAFDEVKDKRGFLRASTSKIAFVPFSKSNKLVRQYGTVQINLTESRFHAETQIDERHKGKLLKISVTAKDPSQIDEKLITEVYSQFSTVIRFEYEIIDSTKKKGTVVKSDEIVFSSLNHAKVFSAYIERRAKETEVSAKVKEEALRLGLEVIESCLSSK